MATSRDNESGNVAASSDALRDVGGIVSAPGAVQAAAAAGPVYSFVDHGGLILTNIRVQLIFWGLSWGDTPSPTINGDTNAMVNILSGTYMLALNQCDRSRHRLKQNNYVVTCT